MLACNNGHMFQLDNPPIDKEIIAAILPCPMADCPGTVVWKRGVDKGVSNS